METLVKNTAVDTMGLLLAQIADLEAQVEVIKKDLKAQGQGTYEGAMYKANVIVATRTNVDYKQVFAECAVPAEVIARNSKSQEVVSVKLTSR
jgi:hypothetical protein